MHGWCFLSSESGLNEFTMTIFSKFFTKGLVIAIAACSVDSHISIRFDFNIHETILKLSH